jgi:hypothetical protein
MTRDELRGHVTDVLALPLSDDQTIEFLLSRVNGADPKRLLVAALAVARELLHEERTELEDARNYAQELRGRIKRFADECETI